MSCNFYIASKSVFLTRSPCFPRCTSARAPTSSWAKCATPRGHGERSREELLRSTQLAQVCKSGSPRLYHFGCTSVFNGVLGKSSCLKSVSGTFLCSEDPRSHRCVCHRRGRAVPRCDDGGGGPNRRPRSRRASHGACLTHTLYCQ